MLLPQSAQFSYFFTPYGWTIRESWEESWQELLLESWEETWEELLRESWEELLRQS